MDKKKTKTGISEIKKKMRRLTLSKNVEKEKQKQEPIKKDKQSKISQRVKVSVNIPTSLSQQPGSFLQRQYENKEQTSLLKSINDQLKKRDDISTPTKTFSIPEPKKTNEFSSQTEPKKSYEFSSQTEPKQSYEFSSQTEPKKSYEFSNQTEDEDNIFEEELRKEILKLKRSLPPEFTSKISPQPIISDKTENIPIINKPQDKSNLSLIEQLPKIEEELQSNMDKELEKNIKEEEEERKKRGRKKLTDEEKIQRAEEAENKKQELRRKRELENIEKELEAEAQRELEVIQKELSNKKKKALQAKQISDKAFNVLLSETPELEKAPIRRKYEVDDLSDAEIRIMLKRKYGYTDEELKRIFSLK